MLIFHFSNGAPGRSGASWGVLMIPLVLSLLSGDLIPAVLTLLRLVIESFFGLSFGSPEPPPPPSPRQQQRHGQPRAAPSSNETGRTAQQVAEEEAWMYALTVELIRWVIFTVSAVCFFRASVFLRRRGGWPALRQFLTTGRFPPRRRQTARRTPQPPRVTVEAVAEALQKVPTELHASKEELQAMHVHDLKARLEARGVDCSRFLEKQELLRELHDSGGSSATSCSICCDDYASGDAVRVMPCQHKYHLECIDKWLLSSTDFSRPPACPLCNAPLIKQPAQPESPFDRPPASAATAHAQHHPHARQHAGQQHPPSPARRAA